MLIIFLISNWDDGSLELTNSSSNYIISIVNVDNLNLVAAGSTGGKIYILDT